MSDIAHSMIRRLAETAYHWREEPFNLSSGTQSNEYIDAKQFLMNSWNAKAYAEWVAAHMFRHGLNYVGGPSMGGALIVGAVTALHGQWMQSCRGFVVREKPKTYGTGRLIEGFIPEPDSMVMIVEDVITTGVSVLDTIECIEANGAKVVSVCCLIDREEGGKQMLEALGLDVYAYTTLSSIREFRDGSILTND